MSEASLSTILSHSRRFFERREMHCPKCQLTVAPQDPEKVMRGKEVFHRSCLNKAEQMEVAKSCHAPRQGYFRFLVFRQVH